MQRQDDDGVRGQERLLRTLDTITQAGEGAGKGAAVGAAIALVAQGLASSIIPTVMSTRTLDTISQAGEGAGKGAAVGSAIALIAQGLASSSIPMVMSTTSTVVAGVGSIHGATTAAVTAFAVAPIVVPCAAAGVIIGGCIGLYSRL